tara:strand:- start:24969 stop:25595 length:627 start_codon:yes stop_codon:yes gene_type:complete
MTMLNIGAGRGANILEEYSPYRRKVQTFKGRVSKLIGIDVDPVVMENPELDEAYIVAPKDIYPLADNSIDIIVSDHVLEHVEFPLEFATELHRVLKPGGWFCARTPVKWGYIGIGARLVPNSLHVKILKMLQPGRKAEDIFDVFYRINSRSAIRRAFPPSLWKDCTYGFNGVPGYHGNRKALFRLVEFWCWLMPRSLSAKFHIFIQKR